MKLQHKTCVRSSKDLLFSCSLFFDSGKIYDFASPKEIEFLIKKSKSGGKSMGVFNDNLFLIIDKNILYIPLQKIVTSTDKQIINLVNKETDIFIKKNIIEESDRLIKHRLIFGAKNLKRLYLLNKLQNNFNNNTGSYISFYFSLLLQLKCGT